MLDKRCCGSRETGLFRVWTMEWCRYTLLFFFNSRSHCQRLKSAWPLAHPLLSHGGFYLAISSSCGGLPGRLNGAMFPVSQIFKWKPTMKVRPLRAAARRPPPPAAASLLSAAGVKCAEGPGTLTEGVRVGGGGAAGAQSASLISPIRFETCLPCRFDQG